MTTQQKLDKIYEVIADKTLSLGCMILVRWIKKEIIRWGSEIRWLKWIAPEWMRRQLFIEQCGIIWHPVVLWDVLAWVYKNLAPVKIDWVNTMLLWNEHRKPLWDDFRTSINNQSDDYIDYIYNLLS